MADYHSLLMRAVANLPNAGTPATNPVRIQNLIATVLHTLFDVGELRLLPGLSRELAQTMTGWEPIPGLMG